MFAMDANFSLKRMASGNRNEGDTRVFYESDYFLKAEEVERYAEEVSSARNAGRGTAVKPGTTHADGPDMSDDEGDNQGDPTDGDRADVSGCTVRWKAAASDEKKKMWAIFEECGLFTSACRHGMMLWITDLIRCGELYVPIKISRTTSTLTLDRAKFPLAIVGKALEVFKHPWIVGYDIGCSFNITLENSSLGPVFTQQGNRCCVNAFHGYSHNFECQKKHHPNVIEGMGLEDLETLERVFSSSNQLGGVTRYMSKYRRRIFIDLFFQQWDAEKYSNLGNMLYNNYVQALKILEEDGPALEHAKQSLNIMEGDLERWQEEEIVYFRNLGKEAEYDIHRVAYVELLQKYRDVR